MANLERIAPAQNLYLLLLTPFVLAGCISMFKSVELNIIEQTISSWAFGIDRLIFVVNFLIDSSVFQILRRSTF